MLVYEAESGALNEHISDVFGIMVKQHEENKTAKDANWLIGEGCLVPGQAGVALRSMIQPGTAYNDIKGVGNSIQHDQVECY
jgi:Zn-dependent metalloprotease